MALPSTITSVGFLATISQGRSRPYISSAGNVYWVQQNAGFTDTISVFKNTDPGAAGWTIVNLQLTGNPELFGIGTFQDGDDIHVATQDSNDEILYHVYSMSSDSFTTSNQAVTSAVGTNIDTDKAISISLETDGSVIIFYQGASDNNMGQKERVDYAYKPSGGSWTVDQAVDDGGKVNFFLSGIVRGEADKFHLVYKDDSNVDALHKSVQDVDGTLSSVEVLNDSIVITEKFPMIQPVYYDDDGVERITTFWVRDVVPDPFAFTAKIDDDGTPDAQESANIRPIVNGEFTVQSAAVDEKTVWLLSGHTTEGDDLFSNSNTDDGGWSTITEELDAITLSRISSNVYQRGSNVVLAYVYNDGVAIKYNEKFLRSVATPGNLLFSHPHRMEYEL